MPSSADRKSLLIILSVFSFVILGTYGITLLARGYRPNLQPGGLTLNATGLLSATSRPKSASVYINDSLITATDDTVNLTPGEYLIKIAKDGYFDWQKTIRIKKEIVYQTDAELFRSSPDLRPITQAGAINPTISPDYSRIIYSVASSSAAANNGLYLIELTDNPLYLSKNTPRQLAPNFPSIDWSKATFAFSPNARQVLVSFKTAGTNYLINLDTPIVARELVDVTLRLTSISRDWALQDQDLILTKIDRLPEEIRTLVSTASAQNISFSPGDDKILYLSASDSAIPENLITPPPAQSTQPQSRRVSRGNFYVYDLKDDTNFFIGSSESVSNPFWLQNSSNLIYVEDSSIKAVDYDGTNKITLFAGNINSSTVYPWTDGSKIIVLTSPYTGSFENLYAITIR